MPAEVCLSEVLGALSRTEEALYHADRAISLDPRCGRARALRGMSLAQLGDLDLARTAFENAIEYTPSSALAYLGLADLGSLTPHSTPFRKLEQNIDADDGSVEKHTAVFHFAMGRALENDGKYRRSIRHYLIANTVARKSIDYDEAACVTRLSQIRTTFSAEFIASLGLGDNSPVPIFVVGMPRSGTTLVEQILSGHPDLFGAGEISDLLQVLRINDFSMDLTSDLSVGSVARIGRDYVRQVRRYSPAAKHIVNKNLNNFEWLGLIRVVLPNAKIIHLKRDPVDTCVSCFSKYIPTSFVYDLGKLGRYSREYDGLMRHWLAVLPKGWILEVSYEELVRDHVSQVRRILEFCGIEWHDECLAFHEVKRQVRTVSMAQVRTPLYSSAIGRWRGCYGDLKPLLDALGPLVCYEDQESGPVE